ncbi:MAG TPA: L,D-transpeptidase [Salinarimonas sp.]|nr:L,D-transpeptidase [Salinarimonas sp.]
MRRFPLIALSALAIAALAGEARAARTYGSDIGSVLMPDIGEPTDATGASPAHTPVPRQIVPYAGPHAPGTIVVSTAERRLYLVMPGAKAMRYGIGVGRPGFTWGGVQTITRKAEWPDWRPPAEMLKRRPDLPRFMRGGEDNPLGARAMYLGSTIYRIHGSNEPDTIGQAVSSGCIRMTNEDVADLYERVRVGTTVVVLR